MLISDGVHMLSHATALGLSFAALVLANRRTDDTFPAGLYRAEVLAALINGVTLAGFTVWIVVVGIQRLLSPIEIHGAELTFVALLGLAVNATTAVVLLRAGIGDLNTKSAFVHMLADMFSSIAIVLGGVTIYFTGWVAVDPILSIVVAMLIGRWSWGLLRASTLILMERKPEHLDLADLTSRVLGSVPEVKDIHDVHVWEITSQFVCLSAHVVVDDMAVKDAQTIRSRIGDLLRHHYEIGHVVIQIEC